MKLKLLALVSVLLLSSVVWAAPRTELLGVTHLGRAYDATILDIHSCAGSGRDWDRRFERKQIHALKLRVLRSPARIDHLVVEYGNGVQDVIPVRARVPAGAETPWLDLRGGARCVRSIQVSGETLGLRVRQSRIQVWAAVETR